MEFGDLTDKEFKIAVLKKLNELQGNSEGQINKIRKIIHKHNANKVFTQETETIKSQTENLEVKNSMNKINIQ